MVFNLGNMNKTFESLLSKDFIFMTAPLEGFTDSVYRSIAHRYGADLTFTEMARIDGLARGNMSTFDKIVIPDNTPTQIQLVGSSEPALKKFLNSFVPSNGFLGFNLNLGCPSSDIVKTGSGCAMIKRVSKVNKMVLLIKSFGYPCSVKLRLGLNKFEKDNKVYLNLIRGVDADFFVVHTRHGKEGYDVPADHSVLIECIATGKSIIVNGDIHSVEQVHFLKRIGAKGVMIGRAAIPDMALFNNLKGLPCLSSFSLRDEYLNLAVKRDSKFKFRENILKRLN
ncbi:MAG: tRNA-dihydrouridine synthase family protein [Candidatus Woesearchaeota archaeon]